MGKDFKKRFTVSLDIDTKDAEKQIKSTVGNLKTILADLGSASDKMTYFKELADYLSQVDSQLDAFRQKYGEGLFNQMFGGLDTNLQKELEGVFGVAKEQLTVLEQLKEKVATVKNSGTATGADLKPLEQEVRSLYESVGMLDKLDLSGKGKVETRIKKLEAALNGFAVVWDGLNNKVKNGFNFGNNGAENIISKLQSVKSMAESINNFEPIDIDCEVSIESATKLIEKFKELSAQRDLLINSGDMESEKYASVYAEQVKTAAQLIELREKLTSIGFESNQIKPINDFIDTEKNNVEGILEEFLEDVDELSSNFNNLTSTVGNGLNQIGEFADSAKSKIDFLNQSLQDILISASQLEVDTRNDKATGKETMNLFGGNGLISKVDGTDYQVDTDALVQQLLANLKQNIIMSLHNHANGLDVFSPSDVESFAKLYYGQGTKINGIIANGIVKTIDFSGVSQEVAIKIAQSYSENIKSFTSRYADYFSFDNGEFNLTDKVKQLEITNPSQYAQIVSSAIDGINVCLNDAFIKNGVEPTIQAFQKDELPQLAKYLSDIEQSGQNAIDPIEKLKNLITTLRPDQTFDWSQFSDIFEKFKSGAIDGSRALNQILNFKTVATDAEIATTSIDQAELKVKEFLALADEIQNKSFDNAWDATDNVEIGKYTERLNIAKAALDELGNQGRLTAEQLEQVNNAFNQATKDLDVNTRTYDAYASDSSSAYDYYDEYERERDKADQLEQENESLREQLSKKQQTTEEYTNAENASLERKLELLSDIADQYANNITQRDRNRYEQLNYKDAESGLTSKEEDRYFELGEKIDEADEQLQQFGETYDKILLKLANGKTIEILPDDAGLRKLYKIANEFYQGEYDGIEIEDAVFMRKQEQAVIEQNNQELERQLDIQEQIATAQKETPESQQAETIANNTKAITSWEELCQVVERYNELCRNSFTEGQSLTDVEGTEKSRIENRFMATKGALDDPDKFVDYMISMERMAGIMGEYDVNRLAEYFGIEIPQAAAKATEAIQEVTQATDGSSTPPDTSVTTAKYEVETQVVKQQNDELERNQQLKAQEGTLDANSSIIGDMSQELNQLDELHAKLIVVKEAIDAKTKAFEEEYVTVDAAIDAEVQSLQLLLEKLQEVLNKINLVSESFTKANAEIAELKGTKEVDVKENITSETIVNKAKGIVSQDYALDTTLLKTNGILNQILAAIGNNESLAKMVEPLNAAVAELKNVANGIVEHQKAQRTDLTDSSARIANNYGQLSSITGNAVAGLGGEVQIENMKALADNIVRVRGAVQNADGVWKGFVVDIDESNKAVIRAVDEQSVFAKSLNEAAQAAKKVGEEAKQTGNDSFTKSLTEQTNVFNKYRENLKDVSYISDDLKDKLDNLGTSLHQVTDTAGLNAWKNSFSDIQKEVTLAENTFIAQQTGKVNQAQKALKDAFKKSGLKEEDTNLTDEQQKIVDGYMQAKAAFEAYNKLAQKGNQIELSTLQNVTNELYQQIEAYKQKNNIVDGSKKTYGDNAIATAKGKYNSLSQIAKNDFADSTVVQDVLSRYTAAYQKLIDKQKEYKAGQELNTDQKAEFKQLQTECNKYATELNKLITTNKKFEESAQNVTKVDEDFVDTAEGRMKALQDFVQTQYGATAEIGKFDAACEKLTFTINNGNGTFTQMTAAINPARNAIGAMVGETEKATTAFGQFFNELKGKFKSIFAYLISSMSMQEVWQQIKQGVNYVREIDSALTELKKVTDETEATYEKFLQTASKTASIVGSTVSELTTMSAEWARLGYSIEDSVKLAESTALLLNVSEFENATEASEALISTMQAFQYTADQSEHVVDILNEVGNNYAISSDGIATALQDSASALMEGGNNLEQAVALIAAAMKNWLFI